MKSFKSSALGGRMTLEEISVWKQIVRESTTLKSSINIWPETLMQLLDLAEKSLKETGIK